MTKMLVIRIQRVQADKETSKKESDLPLCSETPTLSISKVLPEE